MALFTIEESDWDELKELYKAMDLSTITESVDDNFQIRAYEAICSKWNELGIKYGFKGSTTLIWDFTKRTVKAQPTSVESER